MGWKLDFSTEMQLSCNNNNKKKKACTENKRWKRELFCLSFLENYFCSSVTVSWFIRSFKLVDFSMFHSVSLRFGVQKFRSFLWKLITYCCRNKVQKGCQQHHSLSGSRKPPLKHLSSRTRLRKSPSCTQGEAETITAKTEEEQPHDSWLVWAEWKMKHRETRRRHVTVRQDWGSQLTWDEGWDLPLSAPWLALLTSAR